jgi:type IV secretion system protein VirB4
MSLLSSLLGNEPYDKGVSFETPVADFIPYACHYNTHTLLTKNGELLQVIKMIGFSLESVGSQEMSLRNVVRQAIRDNIPNSHYSLWFHTIRRKKSLNPGGNFPYGFAEQLNDSWNERNQWDEQYVNELYVTILHDPQKNSMKDIKDLSFSWNLWTLRKSHRAYLEKACVGLDQVAGGFLKTLGGFGAKRMTITKDPIKQTFYSEPLQFIHKILNLHETPVEIKEKDLSESLATHKIAFGFNTLEVRKDEARRFAAIFTIKEYHEISLDSIDKFLQLPVEFIITQTLDFIAPETAVKEFKEQHYLLHLSGDTQLAELSGLDNIIESNRNQPNDFGQSQMTLMLIGRSLERLEKDVALATKSLSRLGMVATRRDLRMEECFWSQLPGNFEFITRQRPLSSNRIGGMASLYNFPAGNRFGNHWGPAVAAFHTIKGTPYFFDFHGGGTQGHTAILGPKGAGKTVLMNFLVAQAQKFNGKLFFFDQDRASKVFIRSMNGHYAIIDPKKAGAEYAFNPFQMDDLPQNKEFLVQWLLVLINGDEANALPENNVDLCTQAVDKLFTLEKEQRYLSNLVPFLKGSDMEEKLAPWYGKGKYAHLFDNVGKGTIKLDESIYGFGMSHVVEDKVTLGPVLLFLFHRIEMLLDGRPTIIVLDEAWSLVNNSTFAPKLDGWLQRMSDKNAIVIFATENMQNMQKSEMTNTITHNITTQIFLPNPEAEFSSMAYKKVWGLDDTEYEMLTQMIPQQYELMLRQGGNSIVATLNLSGMKELHILSGSDKTASIMDEVVAQHGDNPEDWLPVFYDKNSKL